MANVWTPASLAGHIIGQLNQSRNAAGGSVPDRLGDIVQHSYSDLWECHPWKYRRVRATLTLTASTATADLPDAFEKLDQKWLEENNDKGALRFTTDVQAFEERRYLESGGESTPVIALIQPKTSETTKYVWEAYVAPTPNADMTYPYVYLRIAPDVALDGPVLWPQPMHRGWELKATYRAQRAFNRGDGWKEGYGIYRGWLENAKSENDETLVSSTPVIRDGYGDISNLASTYMQFSGRSIQG